MIILDRNDTPKLENGDYDFESLRSLDLDLFNKQLSKLLDGDKVLLHNTTLCLEKGI